MEVRPQRLPTRVEVRGACIGCLMRAELRATRAGLKELSCVAARLLPITIELTHARRASSNGVDISAHSQKRQRHDGVR